jgi:hypothetical protein
VFICHICSLLFQKVTDVPVFELKKSIQNFANSFLYFSTMQKTLRTLAALSILASSLLFAQSAAAIGTLYSPDTRSGDVACTTSGWFSISNNAVFPDSNNCRGTAIIPSGVTSIGYRAFYNVPLSGISISSSVTSIGEQAFARSTLTSITIPNTVTSIGPQAFYNTSLLTSVTLGNGITAIADRVFEYATALTSITIPSSVRSIGYGSFWVASSLTSLTIPSSVTAIGQNAFASTANLLSYSFCDPSLTQLQLTNTGLSGKRNSCLVAIITAGHAANSKVATFSNGATEAVIPGSTVLPAIKLSFSGNTPTSVTVVPTTNPATPSATPFMASGSPLIVDITPSSHNGSQVTICLDGLPTDHLYQYTGGQWVELTERPYANGQVCGLTTSFAAFVAAPAAPLVVPDPPTIETATATGTTTASLAFAAPESDGRSPIISYTATSTPGLVTATVTQSGSGVFSITGLTPNTTYSFTVTALNAIGTSVSSSASNSITTERVPTTARVSPGSTNPSSRVATFVGGVREALIPVSTEMPSIKLAFTGTAPSSLTVIPLSQSQASLSAAPFMVSSSTQIVDIQITNGHDGSIVKICLDGSTTDQLFHFTGGSWVELPSRTYENNQVCGETTSFSPFVAAPVIPAPVYVAPTPMPYLKTITSPKMNLKNGKAVCTPGTYNSGYTLDGVIQGSAAANFNPINFVYDLLLNGVVQTSKSVSTTSTSTSWDLQSLPSGSLIACSVSVSANSLTNTDKSTDNAAAVSPALIAQAQEIKVAETIYAESLSANSKSYQKALVDNRAIWRKEIEAIQSNYSEALSRIKAKGGPKASYETSAALKLRIAASKKSAADYAASKPAALATKDAANKAALEAKTSAIAKANSTYGTFIESIGYGVLIP